MGYRIYILRSAGGEKVAIAEDEFVQIAQALGGFELRRKNAGAIADFTTSRGIRSLEWRLGEVCCVNPDKEIIEAMLRLAGALHARVRGEEYETYRSPGETYLHPDDEDLI
jgi:hypothetical protein